MSKSSSELANTDTGSSAAARSAATLAGIVRSVAITVPPTATLQEAASLMASNEVGLVVVISDHRLLGVASERDLVVAMADGVDPEEERIEDVMSLEVVSADIDMSPGAAIALMLEGGMRHLPVVSDDRVVGVVSMRDLAPLVASD
jgi:CBS domain-containing protein